VHFINGDVSPAVKLHSGIISHVVTELDITCLPGDLPEFVEVDLANLDVGHSIHLADIKLPKGVAAVIHGGEDNPTIATAAIPAGKVEAEAEATAAAAPAAEDADKADKADKK
jgi:large subunit ribosomal protein L25